MRRAPSPPPSSPLLLPQAGAALQAVAHEDDAPANESHDHEQGARVAERVAASESVGATPPTHADPSSSASPAPPSVAPPCPAAIASPEDEICLDKVVSWKEERDGERERECCD